MGTALCSVLGVPGMGESLSLKIKFSARWKPREKEGQDPWTVRVQRPCRRAGLWLQITCKRVGRGGAAHSRHCGNPGCHLFQDSRIFPERQCQQLPNCPVGISRHEAPWPWPGRAALGIHHAQAKGQLKIVCLANGTRLDDDRPAKRTREQPGTLSITAGP